MIFKTAFASALCLGLVGQFSHATLFEEINARKASDEVEDAARVQKSNLRTARRLVESEARARAIFGPEYEASNHYLYYRMSNGKICGVPIAGTPETIIYVYGSAVGCR